MVINATAKRTNSRRVMHAKRAVWDEIVKRSVGKTDRYGTM